jgi:hypothetical protein
MHSAIWERHLLQKGQTKEAIENLETALSFDPSLYRLHYRLSELYRQTGRPDLGQKPDSGRIPLRRMAGQSQRPVRVGRG